MRYRFRNLNYWSWLQLTESEKKHRIPTCWAISGAQENNDDVLNNLHDLDYSNLPLSHIHTHTQGAN